jgi:hypothetical protein
MAVINSVAYFDSDLVTAPPLNYLTCIIGPNQPAYHQKEIILNHKKFTEKAIEC